MAEFTRLEELSKEIEYFSNLIKEKTNGKITYHLRGGTAESFLLFEDVGKNISVVKTLLHACAEFEPHVHKDITEWIFVYNGELKFALFNEDHSAKEIKVLKAGDSFRVPANEIHGSLSNNVDTEFVVVTMPSDRSFDLNGNE